MLVGSALAVVGVWYFWKQTTPQRPPAVAFAKRSLPPALEQRLAEARLAPPEQAETLYQELTRIEAHTPDEQYVVGYAHYQIGKLKAEKKQFDQAKKAFEELEQRNIDTPALPLDPSFGTWSEQGAYQAAICAYQLDPQEGIRQMIQFMEQYPTSPLVIGAYKRIMRWTQERPPKEAERAWQKAQSARLVQMKRASACGPKALAYVLREEFGIEVEWQTLMNECGTDTEGTSLWALAESARRRGISAVGLEVSTKGLLEQPPPFLVWNPLGHYVAVLERDGKWHLYDPDKDALQPWDARTLHSALQFGGDHSPSKEWRGAVLVLRPRTLANQTDGGKQR